VTKTVYTNSKSIRTLQKLRNLSSGKSSRDFQEVWVCSRREGSREFFAASVAFFQEFSKEVGTLTGVTLAIKTVTAQFLS
jgi:hypothetical protein